MIRPVEHVIVEADGGSRGNPGPAGYGAVVLDGQTREILAERGEAIGVASNNVAEYRGLIAGLTAAADLGARRVSVWLDSKLIVEQMSGRWQVKHPDMRPLAREAAALRSRFDAVSFDWMPREKNTHADRLANEAMDRAAGITPRARPGVNDSPEAPAKWVLPDETPTRLLLIRHGATAHSLGKRFSGRNELPLNSMGLRQAEEVAANLDGVGVAAVISSPFRRAQQTAEAIGRQLDMDVENNDDLAEVDFGSWEGRSYDEVRRDQPAELDAWLASPDVAPPGGESFAAVARRVRRGRDTVIAAHPGQTVAVVTHVTPIKTLIRLALDAPPASLFRLYLNTGSISIVDYYADGACSVRLVNHTENFLVSGLAGP
ncbi:MAG: bifunctional RNase H/acid phosphatase [Actinomycetota bacterium]|nr:bifunctional RNase H/acid phosphatase [Actinomycetota bacterium]